MLWLLLLHISAVVCWCGSLLYLSALIADAPARQAGIEPHLLPAVAPMLFRLFATPAALIAIATGTALFVTRSISEFWLIPKLTLVVALVLCHAFGGWIMLYAKREPYRNPMLPCLLLGIAASALIPAILWLVLNKPF